MSELKQKVINALENLEYYDVVNENCESLEAELIADAVFEVIADYLKGGATDICVGGKEKGGVQE